MHGLYCNCNFSTMVARIIYSLHFIYKIIYPVHTDVNFCDKTTYLFQFKIKVTQSIVPLPFA